MGRLEGARTALGVKAPCYVATTANITLSGFQTIDGVAFTEDTENKRVLVKNQTDTTENGIYVQAESAWTRAKDFDGNTDFQRGSLVYVTDGSANGGTIYSTVVTDPPDIGDSAITFTAETFNTGDVTGPASSGVNNVAGWADTGGGTLNDLGAFADLLAGAAWTEVLLTAAATADLGSTEGSFVTIQGDTTITSFGTGDDGMYRVIYFDGEPLLTHGANLNLPGSANIQTVTGDMAIFISNSTGVWFCVHYQRYAGRTLNSGVAETLTKGFATTSYNLGTLTTGTTTLDVDNGNFQHFTNGGAFTLAPPSDTCSMVVQQVNNASAGAITVSGFTFTAGDAATTTDGHKFLLFITKSQSYSLLQRKALQ
jgi:hypothetical protein